jgi:hypothetical protein
MPCQYRTLECQPQGKLQRVEWALFSAPPEIERRGPDLRI